jgi:hypothetical protein
LTTVTYLLCDRAATLLERLEEHTSGKGERATVTKATGPADGEQYRGRLWVTRPRPGVDRMASAWLIRRFIDPEAPLENGASNQRSEPAPLVHRPLGGPAFGDRGQLPFTATVMQIGLACDSTTNGSNCHCQTASRIALLKAGKGGVSCASRIVQMWLTLPRVSSSTSPIHAVGLDA